MFVYILYEYEYMNVVQYLKIYIVYRESTVRLNVKWMDLRNLSENVA